MCPEVRGDAFCSSKLVCLDGIISLGDLIPNAVGEDLRMPPLDGLPCIVDVPENLGGEFENIFVFLGEAFLYNGDLLPELDLCIFKRLDAD